MKTQKGRELQEGRGYFGRWLSRQIRAFGLSMNEIANELGISRSKLERHMWHIKRPSPLEVRGYCQYFLCDDEEYKLLIRMLERDWCEED